MHNWHNALIIIAAVASVSIGQGLQTDWLSYSGHEYAVAGPSSAEDAHAFAASVGGYLAAINDEPENTWLTDLVVSFPKKNSVPFPANYAMYIGLIQDDGATEPAGDWRWISGEPVTFVNWESSDPNNDGSPGEEDFGALSKFGTWYDWGNLVREVHSAFSIVERVPELVVGDFDDNERLDVVDIDLLSEAVRSLSVDLDFDLSGNGLVDADDRRFWVEDAFGTLFGDASLDRQVTFIDFTSLSFFFGEEGGWEQGDFDGDGFVRFSDFLILSRNFDKSVANVATVPESSGCLAMILGVSLLSVRRRRRSD